MDLTYIQRTFYPTAAECTFLSTAHRTFSRIYHMLGHKTSLNTFKETEIISNIFSDHNGMKLEISKKRKIGKFTHIQRLNNPLLNNESKKKIKSEIKKKSGDK